MGTVHQPQLKLIADDGASRTPIGEPTDDHAAPQGKRFNADKMRPSLISPFALWMLGKVLQFGAKKYAPHNWTKGLSWEETCDSLQRHYLKFLMGEELDEESQLPHVAHLFCNTMFLVHMHVTGTGKDDRGFVAFKLSEQYRKFFNQQAHPQSEKEKTP